MESKVRARKIRSRSAFRLRQRRASLIPDISFDVVDGDGVVGNRDYLVAKHFDEDRDGRLNTRERKKCMEALSKGWLDRHC